MLHKHAPALGAVASLAFAAPALAASIGRSPAALETIAQCYLNRASEADLDLLTATGITVRVRSDRNLLERLRRLDRTRLSRDSQVDAALLSNALRYEVWRYRVLREQDWNVQRDEDIVRDAVSALPGEDAAPWRDRLLAAVPRLQRLPELFAAVRAQIVPARTPAVHAALVAGQNRGLLNASLAPLLSHRDALDAPDRVTFDTAVGQAKAAFAGYQAWLDGLAARGRGDVRLGARLYDAKVRFEFGTDLSRTSIEQAARRATDDIRVQMYAIAITLPELKARASAEGWGNRPGAAKEQSAITAAVALLQSHHPSRSAFLDAVKADLASATAFLKAQRLVSVPSRPVQVVDMPPEMQGIVPAFFQNQGDHGVFAVSPIPADWDAEKAEDYLRAHNDLYLQNLVVHEAMPGHYLQSTHLQSINSPLRQALGSRAFAEGWAVYAQRMMVEAGYLDHDPLYKLSELNWRLYMTCNALLDIGVQTQGTTRKAGLRLLTQVCLEPESSAQAQWKRATYTSTQLLTYFVGYTEMMALRTEVQRRRSGAFNLGAYNDELLSHGMPPLKYVRELMLGQPIR